MTTPDLPHGLPPLPPVPAGFDRWVYRGTNYSAPEGAPKDHCEEGDEIWFRFQMGYDQTWDLMGDDATHVIEAVREPAEVAEGYEEDVMPGGHTIIRKIAEVPASGVEAPVCDLERKLAEAREALEWAKTQLGKHTRPSPIDKALASINGKGTT